MTETECRKLLTVWKKRLGLIDWRIILSIKNGEDESSYMEIIRSVEYKRAELIVPPWMFGIGNPPDNVIFSPNKQWKTFFEECLVHELLHVIVNEMSVIVRNDLSSFLHRDVHTLVCYTYNHAEERMVDNLAIALVRSFRY
jgi:hypothetical protein